MSQFNEILLKIEPQMFISCLFAIDDSRICRIIQKLELILAREMALTKTKPPFIISSKKLLSTHEHEYVCQYNF